MTSTPAQTNTVLLRNLQAQHLTNKSDAMEQELSKINKEMYERNVELAIRNRTLSALRKMYEIMNTSFGIKDTTEKLVRAIAQELSFKNVSIALVDKQHKHLDAVASYPQDIPEEQTIHYLGSKLTELHVSLTDTKNFCVTSLTQHQTRVTTSLHDIFTPLITEEIARQFQETIGIESFMIYPIYFGAIPLGTLVIGLDKHIGDLSRAERETLKEVISVIAIAIERAQTYEDLQQANDKLKQMDKLKDEFLSVASHELRTPMTAIKSYVWMVLHGKSGPIEPKATEYLNRVFSSTQRLINLVNDMLDVSRIESGRIQWRPEQFNLSQVASDIKNEFMARAAERNLQMDTVITGTIPDITADREKIHQVFENLVGNALKFTPEHGTITVTVETHEDNVRVSVRDNGKGIAKDDLSKLFQKFGRIVNPQTEVPGTGLGLYISKQYIEMQKGKIWAESTEGQGATFIFELPVQPPVVQPEISGLLPAPK